VIGTLGVSKFELVRVHLVFLYTANLEIVARSTL